MAPSSSEQSSSNRGPPRESQWIHALRSGGGVDSDRSNLEPSDQDTAAATVAPVDSSDGVNGGNVKNSAWSTPSNGVADVSPVMGADSWPALSESTSKIVPRSFPSDSVSVDSNPRAPVVSNHLNLISPNPNSTRQKIMKHTNIGGSGGGGGASNFGLKINGTPVSSPFRPSLMDIRPQIPLEKPREMPNSKNSTNWDHGPRNSKSSGSSPHSHGGPDHHRPFHRKGNNGGGGSGLHNGGRRDPDRGVYSGDWNNHPPHYMPPPNPRGPHLRPNPFVRPPPPPLPAGAAQYIGLSPHIRPFVVPQMGFHEFAPPYYYISSPSPFVATYPITHALPPPTMLVNTVDYQRDPVMDDDHRDPVRDDDPLRNDNHRDLIRDQMVLKQIEYYFSDDNLCKDNFLRKKMDDRGWVSVSLIAGFNRVKQLTEDNIPNVINYLADALRVSESLEVQGERIRRRRDWKKWLLDPAKSKVSTAKSEGSTSSDPQSESG